MSDYTALEVEEAIEATDEYDDCGWSGMAYGDGPEEITLRGETVRVEHVKQEGGVGQGDEIWFVIRVGDQLFRKDGYYASHYGSDWDGDFAEVHLVQRLVDFYE